MDVGENQMSSVDNIKLIDSGTCSTYYRPYYYPYYDPRLVDVIEELIKINHNLIDLIKEMKKDE